MSEERPPSDAAQEKAARKKAAETEKARAADEAHATEKVHAAEETRAADEAHAANEVHAADEARVTDEAHATEKAHAADEARAAEKAHAAEKARAADEARVTDPDAWATACEEDLAAERERRRAQHGPPPGSAAEELRRLLDAVSDKLSGLRSPLLGAAASGAAQQMLGQVVRQAKAAVEPVIERNPDVFDHLVAAGSELLAAYHSAVEAQEGRWTGRDTDRQDKGEGPAPGPGERIDLD